MPETPEKHKSADKPETSEEMAKKGGKAQQTGKTHAEPETDPKKPQEI